MTKICLSKSMFFQFNKDSLLPIEMEEINAVVLDWGPWTRGLCIPILSSGAWTCPIRNSEGGAQQSVPTNSPGGYFILMNVFAVSPPGIMPVYDLETSLAKLCSST